MSIVIVSTWLCLLVSCNSALFQIPPRKAAVANKDSLLFSYPFSPPLHPVIYNCSPILTYPRNVPTSTRHVNTALVLFRKNMTESPVTLLQHPRVFDNKHSLARFSTTTKVTALAPVVAISGVHTYHPVSDAMNLLQQLQRSQSPSFDWLRQCIYPWICLLNWLGFQLEVDCIGTKEDVSRFHHLS